MEKKEEQQHFDEQQQIYATSIIDELAIEPGKIEEESRQIIAEPNNVLDHLERRYQQVRARKEAVERFGVSPVFDR